MPRLTINEQSIEVPAGTTVLQAAEKLGIFVPHYCYHGGLSISGNCRICLVEIQGAPKLTTACTQPVAEGMVVLTRSPKVQEGQGDVMEYLLKNHPLDCPVCDQAGECLLQDYYMEYDRKDSRLRETKNRKLKAKSIGPRIVLDQERCILCTRCVRFLSEVTRTGELGVFGRGSREVLDIFPGVEVDNAYDANIVDLCPVGALTDKDFRFKVRSWYLQTESSVCDGCSTGCSISVDYNVLKPHNNEGRRVIRFRPRFNEAVNGHWMCNYGRYSYKKHETDRHLVLKVRPDRKWPDTMEKALKHLATALTSERESRGGGSIGVIVAPSISNEDAFFVRRLFVDALRCPNVDYRIPGLVQGAKEGDRPIDGLLRRGDPWPNSRGLEAMGLVPGPGGLDVAGMMAAAADGTLSHLFIIGADLTASALGLDAVRRSLEGTTSIAFQTHRNAMNDLVDVAFPIATHLEYSGTFTNYGGIVQRFDRVVEPVGGEVWQLAELLRRVGSEAGLELPVADPGGLFADWTRERGVLAGTTFESLAPVPPPDRSQWINEAIVPQL
jgi:NADH-quinone oxidoreductase subunit G